MNTKLHLDFRVNWLDFGGQGSLQPYCEVAVLSIYQYQIVAS